ncbi:MAG TPA: recombinase family protein [Candidatus Paceibacterota bacterium]|nr:recombinase family protein [Candidatus Paceibacterota bacterium]
MNPILYLRTSTKDQNPELQKESGVEFCVENSLGEPDVYSEKGSAYKLEKIRPIWESVVNQAKKEKRDIIIWKYDRCFRNRKEFYDFMKVMFEVYGTKVYSVTEPSIIGFWNMMGKFHSNDPIFNELLKGIFKAIWDFMIQQAGEQAEEESRKKSERVKLAVRKESGITKSYKGNKWGRKNLTKQTIKKVIQLKKENPKLSIREISKQISYYDKNNNSKNISRSAVHKILNENYDKLIGEEIVFKNV